MSLQENTAYSPVYAPIDLIVLVPADAQSVLDVGAGPSGEGRVLREKGMRDVFVAIETHTDYAFGLMEPVSDLERIFLPFVATP